MTGLVAERVIDVLDLLADEPDGLTLSEICRRLGLPKSAAHRLLTVLAGRRFATQSESTERYRLTIQVAALGFRYLSRIGLREILQPLLDRLAAKTGELVRFALVDAEMLTWVAKAQGALSGLKYDPDMGTPVVLHATATGRAWLATLDEATAVHLVSERGYAVPKRFGTPLVTDERTLLHELARTRARGYGLAIEEGEPGTAAVACAVRDGGSPDGPTIGTISVAGPVVRVTRARYDEIAADVRAIAAELSAVWPLRQFSADAGRMRPQAALEPVASTRARAS